MYICIYIKYLPFHKTLPRSSAFVNFISFKVWWNGLYNRDQCVMFTYWCIRGDWDKLQLSWAELELNNVYTSLSWTMYIYICIRPWAGKCTYMYTSLSWTMYIYTSLSCIVCTTVQNVILSCIFSTYEYVYHTYIQWKFKSVGIIHLTLHIILRYNSFLPYPSCVCIVLYILLH